MSGMCALKNLTLMILFCRKKKNMTSSPNMGLPVYAENVAQIMARSVTPTPRRMSARIARNPYVDDEAIQCDDLND